MVYSSRFVMSILVDGQPQKELNGIVPIKFSNEYSLRFRNKHDQRSVVQFTIDGENVSGEGYIIPANSFIDIHRHWNKDVKFKFVELDSPEAVDHGKNGPNTEGNKGVIEAKFYLEKPSVKVPWTGNNSVCSTWPQLNNPYTPPVEERWHTGIQDEDYWMPLRPKCSNVPSEIKCSFQPIRPECSEIKCSFPALQEGCTVEGSRSGQTFVSEPIDLEPDFVFLRCTLKGLPQTEVFTASPSYCTNCGAKKARISDKFCGACGKRAF